MSSRVQWLYSWATFLVAVTQQVWQLARVRSKVEQLHSRARSLVAEFAQGRGEATYIDEAVALAREALELCPPGHSKRPVSLTWLSIHLWERYNQRGVVEDLEEAIGIAREKLGLCPSGHADRSLALKTLGVCLGSRYERLGGIEDLNKATALNQEALELCPPGHPARSMSLNNLGCCLSNRYERLARVEDLNEAITLGREALDLRPPGHPDRLMSLDTLGIRFVTRYRHLGETEDLDQAIVLGREALELSPPGRPSRSKSLNNLAYRLFTRHMQLRVSQDLEEAIVLGREALELRPKGHVDRSWSLNTLALCLSTRFSLHGLMEDLDKAICLEQEAIELRAPGNPFRSSSLNNLAQSLFFRHKLLGSMEDLDESIVLDREALNIRSKGHNNRSVSLNNLAFRLSTRYDLLKGEDDLNEAIVLNRDALDLRPYGHPDRSQSLENLGDYLRTRFTKLRRAQDKEELFSLYIQMVDTPQMASSADLFAARAWINAAEDFQHPSTVLAYETSLRLLVQHLAILPPLSQHLSILKRHSSSLAVDAFSACLRNNAPTHAIELLEQGRGVFWSQLLSLHSPIDDVVASGPAGKMLADEFTHLVAHIRNASESTGGNRHERVCHLNVELQRVVSRIRELPGLSRFLLPCPFLDLQRAAGGGPVVIVNASKYSCDALVVFSNRNPVHIPLQITLESLRVLSTELKVITERAKNASVSRELAFVLRKVWDQIVSPIVDFLQEILPLQSRIWWCPTGEFSALPLHAASSFRKSQKSLPELYISSYTPTLSALIRARRPNFSVGRKTRFVAIGQAKAMGEGELYSVNSELVNIGRLVDGHAAFVQIEDSESCTSRVASELRKNEWVHLACHGLPSPKRPFESAFALHDDRFTIERIVRCDPENPEFAYLSACHTTVGDVDCPDEAIHLASAIQFAGFRSVIGTMWAVDDGHTDQITSTFYAHVVDESGRLDYARTACALNRTMRSVDVPLDQRVLYVHIGA